MHPLDDAKFKVDRAGEYLDSFKHALGEFFALEPYQAIGELDSGEPFGVYHLQIRHDPPDVLGRLIGDFANDLRSSLDFLAWQLALKTTTTPYDGTEFPIFLKRDSFRSRGLPKIRDFPPAACRPTIAVQPYRAGTEATSHALWVVHRLANVTKHRKLRIVNRGIRYSFPIGGNRRAGLTIQGNFEDGDEVPAPNVPKQFQALMDLKVEPILTVAFQQPGSGGIIAVDQIETLYDFVRDDVFPRFERFFT